MPAVPATMLPLELSPRRIDAPMRESLAAAVAEIEQAAASADTLQVALSPLLRLGGEAAEAFQALDEISQHLHGVAEFLAAIAKDCPADWRLDATSAAGRLRLHSQKLRLMLDSPATPAPALSASGELELW